ncbi:MAG: alpha/beta hydrolase family protein [Caulobacteraceae bacterium]
MNDLRGCLAAGAAFWVWATVAAAAPPPIEAFGGLPGIQDAEISPDGQKILMLGGPPTQRQVFITTIDSAKQSVLNLGEVRTRWVRWTGDNYALVRTTVQSPDIDKLTKELYSFDRDVVIDTDAKPVGRLLATDQFVSTGYPIVGVVHAEKPYVMVMGWGESGANTNKDTRLAGGKSFAVPVLMRVDVKSGSGRITEKGGESTGRWWVDGEGDARVRYDANERSHIYTLSGRPKNAAAWKIIFQGQDPDQINSFLGYSDVDDAIYMKTRLADGSAGLELRSLAGGAVTPIPLPSAFRDIGLVWDPHLHKVIGLTSGGDDSTIHWLDSEIGAVFGKLARALKLPSISLASWSRDRTRFLVSAEGPDTPAAWYLFDAVKKELSPIGEAYPELKGIALGKTSRYAYKARDGLEIPAYLTLPPNTAAGAKPPLIVLPHGGPAAHDDDSFDWWTHYLASRGYAVLRPQFRGSSGFGEAFERAGDREWAGKMQTDLLDGVNDAAAKGLIDPKRVCVVGASYGGYAALAAAAYHSDSYRCAAAVAGVSDLPAMIGEYRTNYDDANSSLTYWRKVLGRESGAEASGLAQSSPARHADQVAIPVLLIHGKLDTVVPYKQSESMRDALKAAGKPVDFVTLEGDDHHLSTSPTRTAMLQALDTFLARNNPVN